eukprot:CAMPEP_0117493578 /NCGR_PEP_ID=MMETSP0784-20121206/19169_1 /TAXON_ID=39447 /ORGANISM="" /LENGTH=270 /DNA_ID=CAMNT_0005288433 /DNA_START=99 /DNA_END=911 /DNA_ORIENTATION=-
MQRASVIVQQVMPPQAGSMRSGATLQAETCAAVDAVAKEMAPTGTLRVAINMRNALLVTGKTSSGDPEGLAPSMGAAFAEKLGVPVAYVPYDSPADLAKDAEHDKWDVAMIGADPARAQFVDFTAPYCQIEATYVVPTTSGAQKCEQVDKSGVRIAACKGAAYTLWLERNLKNAQLETVEGHDETYEYFKEEGCQALAGLRSKLKKDAAKRPGTRILKDKFMAVEQAACTKKGRSEGFKLLSEFIEEAKTSGLVRQLMEKFKVAGELAIP